MERLLCEVRFVEDESRKSPGRLTGTLIEYEKRAQDRPELFESEAFKWADGGIVINAQHDRRAAVVRAIPFLDGAELRIDVALPNTTAGRDAATNVKDGLWTGLSTEFYALEERRAGGLRRIRRAVLDGAALVDTPSYLEAMVEIRERANLIPARANLERRARLWL